LGQLLKTEGGGILNYTQDRDEFGTTQQEREIAKALSVDKVRQIQIAKEQGISRQRVGQLKNVAIDKGLISYENNIYEITDYGRKVLGLQTMQVESIMPSMEKYLDDSFDKPARTNLDKKFNDIVENNKMSDMLDNISIQEEE